MKKNIIEDVSVLSCEVCGPSPIKLPKIRIIAGDFVLVPLGRREVIEWFRFLSGIFGG